jgi:hypothetical protein
MAEAGLKGAVGRESPVSASCVHDDLNVYTTARGGWMHHEGRTEVHWIKATRHSLLALLCAVLVAPRLSTSLHAVTPHPAFLSQPHDVTPNPSGLHEYLDVCRRRYGRIFKVRTRPALGS